MYGSTLCDERETWLTRIEDVVSDLEVLLSKRGYKVEVSCGDRSCIIEVLSGRGLEGVIEIVKVQRDMSHLKPLDRYLEPYVLRIRVETWSYSLCGHVKIALMRGGG